MAHAGGLGGQTKKSPSRHDLLGPIASARWAPGGGREGATALRRYGSSCYLPYLVQYSTLPRFAPGVARGSQIRFHCQASGGGLGVGCMGVPNVHGRNVDGRGVHGRRLSWAARGSLGRW